MVENPEINRKNLQNGTMESLENGTELKPNANSTKTNDNVIETHNSELDPCLDTADTKKPSKTQSYRQYLENYVSDIQKTTGLSRRGVFIVGLLVIFAIILTLVVISLAVTWPRIPHKFQYPVCEQPACLRAAAQIIETYDPSISPCQDLWGAFCSGWGQNITKPPDKSIWNQKQQLIQKDLEKVRDLIATLPLPLHTATVEWKLKYLYETCMDVDSLNQEEARSLTTVISELVRPLNHIKMRPFLLACFVALAAARPEPPVGYAYQAPSGGHSIGGGSSHGGSLGGGAIQFASAPSLFSSGAQGYASNGGYSYASGGQGLGSGLSSGGHSSGSGLSLGGHSSGGGLSLGGQSHDGGFSLGGHSSGAGLSFGGHSNGGGLSLGGLGGHSLGHGGGQSFGNGGHGVSSGFDSSSAFTGGIGGGQGGGFGGGHAYAPQAPTVHKHVYVHVAPEEPQEHRAPQHIPVAAPQKHYKIIFIKAPAHPTPSAPIIPVQPQNEEKTLVYVLVKKPEEQPEISIPTPVPTQPSKPEVYFIRYKTQKEQSHGGAGGGISGGGISGGGISGGDYHGPSGIEATAPGSGVIANTGFEGLSHGGSSLGHGGSSLGHGGSSLGHGGSSLGGDLGSGASFSSGGGVGQGYIPPASSSNGGSSKYGPPGYHK